MRVLVTGGAGFIGSHLVDFLLKKGYQVFCVDNMSLGCHENMKNAIQHNNFVFKEMDLLDREKLNNLFSSSKFDLIYHLAANTDVRIGVTNTDLDLNNNVIATFNILDCMRRFGPQKILFTSSPTVFGYKEGPLKEDMSANPESLYGASKLAAEIFMTTFSNLYGIQCWILRLSNIVGSRATHGIIYDFIRKLEKDDKYLEVLGDGNQNKPYMHISELIKSINFITEKTNKLINKINIGPRDTIKVSEIAELILQISGQDRKIRYTGGAQGWKGDVPFYSHDASRLERLGWKTSLTSKESVRLATEELLSSRQQEEI